jgi:hypothetical protein
MWHCGECRRLENEHDCAIEGIRAVVRERFDSVREKIFALHEAQKVRDSRLRLLYDHRRDHPRKFQVHKRKRAVPSHHSPGLVLVS